MIIYLKKKKLLSNFFINFAVFIISAFAMLFLLLRDDYLEYLFPIVVAAIVMICCFIGFMINLKALLWKPKIMVNIDENGIISRSTKEDRKAGLMRWNEIQSIEKSTDNMNKAAIRISLKENRNGKYQYYITSDKIGMPMPELLDILNEHHAKYK